MRKRTRLIIGSLVLTLLAASGWLLWYANSESFRPCPNDPALLKKIMAENLKASNRIKSGKGSVVFKVRDESQSTVWETVLSNDVVFVGDASYRVHSKGNRSLVVGATTTAPGKSGGIAEKALSRLKKGPAPNLYDLNIAFDGQSATVHDAINKVATIAVPPEGDVMYHLDGVEQVIPFQDNMLRPAGRQRQCALSKLIHEYTILSEPRVVGKGRIGLDKCIVVEREASRVSETVDGDGTTDVWRERVWLCPKKGYLCRRCDEFLRDQSTFEYRTDFVLRKMAGGFWVTAGYEVTSPSKVHDGVEWISRKSVLLSPDFQFNVPIKKSDLKITLPKGTKVDDRIKGTTYVVK